MKSSGHKRGCPCRSKQGNKQHALEFLSSPLPSVLLFRVKSFNTKGNKKHSQKRQLKGQAKQSLWLQHNNYQRCKSEGIHNLIFPCKKDGQQINPKHDKR